MKAVLRGTVGIDDGWGSNEAKCTYPICFCKWSAWTFESFNIGLVSLKGRGQGEGDRGMPDKGKGGKGRGNYCSWKGGKGLNIVIIT